MIHAPEVGRVDSGLYRVGNGAGIPTRDASDLYLTERQAALPEKAGYT